MTIPLEGVPLAQQADFVRELADLGYSDAWSSEAQDVDGFTPLALASQWAPQLRLGCACFQVQTRGPALMAMSAAALAEAAPGRFVMGIGSSSPWIVSMQNAHKFERPYQQTRDTLRFLKRALAGEKCDGEYDTFAVRGFALRRKLAQPPPVLVAALRPQMLALAGREGAGAILNFVTPEDVARSAPLVREFGAHKEIAARVYACPTTDAEAVRRVGRSSLAVYLSAPSYRAQKEWLGNEHLFKPIWDRMASGDYKGARAAITDEIVDRFYIHGAPEYCRERIAAYHEAGVDTPIIGLIEAGIDPRKAARDLAPR